MYLIKIYLELKMSQGRNPAFSGTSPNEVYAPPPGPPPGYNAGYTAPPGPPPSHGPQHDWQTAVPDTSLLPPPPVIGHDRSPTNNATEDEADRAETWCRSRPLLTPLHLSATDLDAIDSGHLALIKSPTLKGELRPKFPGHWLGRSKKHSPDSCIVSTLPLYATLAHSPLRTHRAKTIYFEVHFPRSNRAEISLALGFIAAPYPPFRLPGWERASLGVHGDDGHRYVNDQWGGKDFTAPFQPGETVGIGMTFSEPAGLGAPPAYGAETKAVQTQVVPIHVEVFFTRDGKREGGWNLHEENDAQQDLPVTGLEGANDLYAAVGTFESVEFEIIFNKKEWLYRP